VRRWRTFAFLFMVYRLWFVVASRFGMAVNYSAALTGCCQHKKGAPAM
jgi:hypothetical protein